MNYLKPLLRLCVLLLLAVGLQRCTSLDPVSLARLKQAEAVMQGVDKNFRPAALKLIERGVDSSFITQLLHHPNVKFLEKMVKINVTGFIKKADYSHNYNEQSLKATREFFQTNSALLKAAEQTTGVPAEVITSILWVETKFGKITGTNNVASVYASLAAADEPDYIAMNKQSYRTEITNKDSLVLLDSIVEARARKKAAWAIDQIIALRDMQDKLPQPIMEINGSWAGAFGWSQFIPSSYNSWAVDGNGDGKVNLFDKEDAIASVGNYLKVNGWGNTRKQQEAAVYHYNNSKDYVNCVLTLAEKIRAAN